MKIAIIVAQFNDFITEKLRENTVKQLVKRNIPERAISTYRVPGAVELPFAASQLAKKKDYAAIICIGAIIYGETDHYDYVCQMVSQGCMKVALRHDIPVIFGVLTTQTVDLAQARTDGTHSDKGQEFADAALEMLEFMRTIE
jgi:6,7-dimethyl-8-ribityllumazine synthase